MRCKRVKIDSLNLSSHHLEALFINNNNYSIETVKSRSIFKPKIWSKAFGKSLRCNIIEAKIIHSYLGLKLPLKTFAVTPHSQTVEFAGIHGYDERSRLLTQTYRELESRLLQARVTRIDIAIDYKERIPQRIIRALSNNREPFQYGNTTYWKTAKEKKTNQIMDIKIYNKSVKDKLDFPLMRLEFVFKGNYFRKLLLRDIDSLLVRMEKSIKKATGLSVKIEKI